MQRKVTVQKNPSKQEKDRKTLEVTFTMTDGKVYSLLIGVNCYGDKPNINVFRIDEGINVGVAEEREKRC